MTGQDIQRRNLFWLLHRNHHVLCQDPYPHAAAQWRFYSGQKKLAGLGVQGAQPIL